jgi:chromosomal replication initiator protein
MQTTTLHLNYWGAVLDTLKGMVSSSIYSAWFHEVGFVEITDEGRKMILSTRSTFQKDYIQKSLIKELREAIKKYYPKVVHLDFKVLEDLKRTIVQEPLDLVSRSENIHINHSNNQSYNDKDTSIAAYLPKRSLSNLNPKYTFENLVVTKSNEFTVNLAKGVANSIGALYNPFYIHSPVGLGKTHLIQAVGHSIGTINPSINIKYVPSDTLFNQFYISLSKNEAAKFRDYYTSVDVLLVDDIHFIGGKEGFQNELFHLFNLLHQSNKQIIFTSDRTPQELIGVEERLISRFAWGMVTDIQMPDRDDRMSIINFKKEKMNLHIPANILEQVADRVPSNVREIEGVLTKLNARYLASVDDNISNEIIESIFAPYSSEVGMPPARMSISPEDITTAVCRVLSVTRDEFNSSSRKQQIVRARQLAAWLYKTELKLSYPYIGKLLGGRDHTTILSGVRKVKEAIAINDEQITEQIKSIKSLLR